MSESEQSFKENVEYLLNQTPKEFLVRSRQGGGPEDLNGSLAITYYNLQEAAKNNLDGGIKRKYSLVIDKNGKVEASVSAEQVELILEKALREVRESMGIPDRTLFDDNESIEATKAIAENFIPNLERNKEFYDEMFKRLTNSKG